MSTPINLNKVRKSKARADKQRRADENAVKFGLNKSQKQLEAARADRARREIDGHKREEE